MLHIQRRASEPVYPASKIEVTTFLHGSCRRCNHWHNAVQQSLCLNPQHHTSIKCRNCNYKMFGIGRTSSHTSLASQETNLSLSKPGSRRNVFNCCNNIEESPPISPHSQSPILEPKSRVTQPQSSEEHDTHEGHAKNEEEIPTSKVSVPPKDAHQKAGRSRVFAFVRKILPRRQGHVPSIQPLPQRAKKQWRVLGYEIQIARLRRSASRLSQVVNHTQNETSNTQPQQTSPNHEGLKDQVSVL